MLTYKHHLSRAASVLMVLFLAASAAGAVEPAASAFEPLQAMRTGVDDASNAQADRDELQRNIDNAKPPLDEAQARLAMANWLLAVPTAQPATRWLLDMESPEDLQNIAETSREAAEQLTKARAILADLPDSQSNLDQQRQRDLTTSAETLDAFAAIFQRAESGTQSEADQEKWRKARHRPRGEGAPGRRRCIALAGLLIRAGRPTGPCVGSAARCDGQA